MDYEIELVNFCILYPFSFRRARGEDADKAVDPGEEGGGGVGRPAGDGGLQTQRHPRLATKGDIE